MKRIVREWGQLLAFGMALAILSLWAGSRFLDRSTYHVEITSSRGVQHNLHVLVANGDLALCNQFEVDASGNVRPLIINARNILPWDLQRGARFGGFAIPGLEARYYRMASGGYLIWSLRLSLLIPAAVLLLLGLFTWRLSSVRSRPASEAR